MTTLLVVLVAVAVLLLIVSRLPPLFHWYTIEDES